jgi:D-3-phosphoglycerate dehydrogenase
MQVTVYDPYVSDQVICGEGCQSLDLPALLGTSDFVSLTVPLNAETRHLIGERELRQMQPSAYLINTSRGPLIDQEALVRAVREGWIAGAGLDVFDPEPLPDDHPLFSLPEVIMTPHVAYYSPQAQLELRTRAAENVVAVLSGRMPECVVNPQVLDLPRWEHLQ